MNVSIDPPSRYPIPAVVRLSRREIEVLALIGQGYSSKEVSELLFVSKRTVDFHLKNVYTKLSVNNRMMAFRTALRFGLIPYEPTFSTTASA